MGLSDHLVPVMIRILKLPSVEYLLQRYRRKSLHSNVLSTDNPDAVQ